MVHDYWSAFSELLGKPFEEIALIWGIVPLYFALLLNELTSAKASYRTALQSGFSFIWAGVQWLYPYFEGRTRGGPSVHLSAMSPIDLTVTFLVLALGVLALVSGIRKKFPPYCRFLGYTRFSNYFMITIYPMQAHKLVWSWDRLIAIGLFALPIWLVLHFGLMPLRK